MMSLLATRVQTVVRCGMTVDVLGQTNISGRVKLYDDHQNPDEVSFVSNGILYSWGQIVANLLASGNTNYRLSKMYVEYENKTNPEDAIVVPSFSRSIGLNYFASLSADPKKDYFIADVLMNSITSVSDNTNLQLLARLLALTGVHGKPFSSNNNSTIYGCHLAAAPQSGDPTQNILFSSVYFSSEDQRITLPNSSLNLLWRIQLQ